MTRPPCGALTSAQTANRSCSTDPASTHILSSSISRAASRVKPPQTRSRRLDVGGVLQTQQLHGLGSEQILLHLTGHGHRELLDDVHVTRDFEVRNPVRAE